MKPTYLMAAALWTLSACSEPTYDVQYYLDHPGKLRAKLSECKKNGKFKSDTKCINAARAFAQMFNGGRGM